MYDSEEVIIVIVGSHDIINIIIIMMLPLVLHLLLLLLVLRHPSFLQPLQLPISNISVTTSWNCGENGG
jgi:hypothetical protein